MSVISAVDALPSIRFFATSKNSEPDVTLFFLTSQYLFGTYYNVIKTIPLDLINARLAKETT